MRRRMTIVLIGLVLVAATAAAGVRGPEFSGTYDWSDGGSDELSAEFKPDGDGGWKVTFDFRFGGNGRTWKGTATGSLDDGGKVSGTVRKSGRTWEFEGAVENGILRGTHTEIRSEGSRYDTGTFELEREAGDGT